MNETAIPLPFAPPKANYPSKIDLGERKRENMDKNKLAQDRVQYRNSEHGDELSIMREERNFWTK
jgi:hypothetical protein